MPKISIIVPVYNGEKVLSRCIESILNQSYKDFELIIINDGSRDKSKEIIESYKKRDSRIIAIHNNNVGVSQTRNIGIDRARGEFIQFIDVDDYINKDMLKETLKIIEETNSDLVVTGIFIDIENNNEIKQSIQTFKYENVNGKNNIAEAVLQRLSGTYIHSLWNKIFKREIIIKNKILMDRDISLGEDLIFNLEYLKNCENVVFEEKCYYHYCIKSEESLTSKYRDNKLELMKLIYDKCYEYFKFCELEEKNIIELNNLFIKWMYSCFIDLHNNDCKLSIKEELRYIKVSIERYNYIISRTGNMILMLRILKATLRYSWSVWLLSKIIYIIKVKFRQILYR